MTEHLLHASGVIAVVVAGIVQALVQERTETMISEEQVLTENIWSVVSYVLNGVVFLLLGMNIPSSMNETVANPDIGNALAIGYAIAFGVAIIGIRFMWSYFFASYEYRFDKSKSAAKPSLTTTLIVILTGVRGAVTMAGVLSIPYLVASGDPFPERSLILFLAAAVILFTLLAASVFLPLISKEESEEGDTGKRMDVEEAKRKLLLSQCLVGNRLPDWKINQRVETIRIYYSKDRDDRIAKLRAVLDVQIKALQSALFAMEYYSKERGDKDLVHAVTLEYKRIIDRLRKPTAPFHKKKQAQKEELRLKMMDIERSEIRRMFEAAEINRDIANELRRFLNSIESVTLYEHVE